ncbi:Heterogeneous nuclear ribonucleoprotein A1-like 2, partial [Galemys pyrenaicus]
LWKLFTGGLSFKTTNERLINHFGQWGTLRVGSKERSKHQAFQRLSVCHMCHHGADGCSHECRWTEKCGPREGCVKSRFSKIWYHLTEKKVFVCHIKDTEEHHLKDYFEQWQIVIQKEHTVDAHKCEVRKALSKQEIGSASHIQRSQSGSGNFGGSHRGSFGVNDNSVEEETSVVEVAWVAVMMVVDMVAGGNGVRMKATVEVVEATMIL